MRRLTANEWSEVGDLIDQCIQAAEIDESYSRLVRTKAISTMVGIRNKAVDTGLFRKAKVAHLRGARVQVEVRRVCS